MAERRPSAGSSALNEALKNLASERYSLQGRTQVAPRVQTVQPSRPSFRSALSNIMRDAIDATGIEGGYRRGLLNAASGVDSAIDFAPIVGDALGLEDAAKSYNQGDMVGTSINMMGVVPIIGDAGVKLSKRARSALRVRPPSDNITNVRNANFQYPKTIGDETVNINSITGNLRVDQQEQNRINRLADQISSPEGYISRIIVDQNNNVIEGQHRLEALRQLGVKEVPVYKIEELADTMPVRKMEEAINTVGNIHSDHVNQIMQYALDNIAEEGVQGARNFDFGNFQKYYDAALNAVEDGAIDLYSGGGRQGSAIAGGSALRETFRIGDEGFDPRFDSRAKEQQRILDTELTYEGSPIVRPEVSIFDYEGKPFRITMADRTKAGSRLTGVEGVDYDLPVELQGGQDFMFANPAGREGQVWAQDRGATSAFLNSFMGLDGKPIADEVLMLPYRMAPSGGDFSTMTGEVMVTHARNAVSKKAKRKADKTIKEFYPAWKGIDNPESIDQIREMTGDPRKSLLQVMDRDLRDEGGLGIGQARLAVSDRAQYNAPDFNLQNVGVANPYGDSRFEVSGHRTYGQGLAGRPEGILREQDINVFELMPDLVSARGFDSVDSLLRADPATLAKEQYTLRRGTRGGVITEEMLRDIEARRAN